MTEIGVDERKEKFIKKIKATPAVIIQHELYC